MIPLILAAVGGYFIGDSMKSESKEYADGGTIEVYRGEPKGVKPLNKDAIWVTTDINYASEYGKTTKYTIPNDLNLVYVYLPNNEEVFTDDWEELVNGFYSDRNIN